MSSCGVMVCECNGPRCVTRDVFCVSCKLSNTQKCINSRCRQSYYGSVTFMESPPFIIAAMHSRCGCRWLRRNRLQIQTPDTRLAAALIKSRRSAVDNGNATVRQLFAFKLQSHYTLNTFNSIFNLDPVRTFPPRVEFFTLFFDGFPYHCC